ncbi:hypothetical protein [Methylobrevis pamukkalensis]|uniref:Uncharacterized protein n=1 Tax=Methylobrevis pamukkalensis TaxID=1439726 RepID=A0A1E3H1B3_9HYPH|nr:hypothetical protein [Methylobrevis pamukkalensis]ODN70097.1 hypothetical protein A6302_02576 [Methylobrevis pamukkalensis]
MHRTIFRLEPRAEADDPGWTRAPSHGVVIVRADSAADARIVASEGETDFLETPAKPGDGVSTRFASAFRDDKLYHVVEDESGRHAAAGPRGILEGLTRPDVIRR